MPVSVLTVEGLLRKEVGGAVIPTGRRLYESLRKTGQVFVFTYTLEEAPLHEWFTREGLVVPSGVYYLGRDSAKFHDVSQDTPELGAYVGQLNSLRAQGFDVDLVIDVEPAYTTAALNAGFTTMLFVEAQYRHPDWRPGPPSPITPWDTFEALINTEREMKVADNRLKDEDEDEL